MTREEVLELTQPWIDESNARVGVISNELLQHIKKTHGDERTEDVLFALSKVMVTYVAMGERGSMSRLDILRECIECLEYVLDVEET
jgi:hypothetical protein